MKDINFVYELCDIIEKEGKDLTERLRTKTVPLNERSIEYVDKLTHIMKSLACIVAMEEEKMGEDESYRTVNTTEGTNSYRGSYRGGSMRGGSRDGGGSGRRGRDSMGRYTSRASYDGGYSGAAEDLVEHLEKAMHFADDEKMKQELQHLIREANQM